MIDLNESTLYGGGKENSPPASVESLKSELKILKENENKLEVKVNDLRKNKKKLKTELGSLKGIIFTKMGSTDLNLNLFFNKIKNKLQLKVILKKPNLTVDNFWDKKPEKSEWENLRDKIR